MPQHIIAGQNVVFNFYIQRFHSFKVHVYHGHFQFGIAFGAGQHSFCFFGKLPGCEVGFLFAPVAYKKVFSVFGIAVRNLELYHGKLHILVEEVVCFDLFAVTIFPGIQVVFATGAFAESGRAIYCTAIQKSVFVEFYFKFLTDHAMRTMAGIINGVELNKGTVSACIIIYLAGIINNIAHFKVIYRHFVKTMPLAACIASKQFRNAVFIFNQY